MPDQAMTSSFPFCVPPWAIVLDELCARCREIREATPCRTCPVRPLKAGFPAAGRAADARVRRVAREIHRRCAEPLRVRDLASLAGMSASRLGRLFRRDYGTSVTAYVRRRRLERARLLLASTDLRVSEIAYASGWSDPVNFTHAFRKAYGTSPTRFRGSDRSRGVRSNRTMTKHSAGSQSQSKASGYL